jgi:hypothetical protein
LPKKKQTGARTAAFLKLMEKDEQKWRDVEENINGNKWLSRDIHCNGTSREYDARYRGRGYGLICNSIRYTKATLNGEESSHQNTKVSKGSEGINERKRT